MRNFLFIFPLLMGMTLLSQETNWGSQKSKCGERGWCVQESGVMQSLRDVSFVDTLNGWTVGYHGTILHTSDGGNNWEVQYCADTIELSTIGFRNNTEGWAGGDKGEPWYTEAVLLYTTDAGSTWIEEKGNKTLIQNWIADISIPDSTGGFYLERYRYSMFPNAEAAICNIFTGLCEMSWCATIGSYGYKMHFIDSLHAWYLTNLNWRGTGLSSLCYLFSTTAGPESLKLIDSFSVYIEDLDFVDSLQGWMVGDTGTILHTEDAGATWVSQISGVTNAFYGIDFVDSSNGWVVGSGGVILRTRDGGEHWTIESSPVSSTLYQVCFVDTSHGWAVGSGGTILCYSSLIGLQETETESKPSLKNYPNPFAHITIIKYSIPRSEEVSLKIYDISGRLVRNLVNREEKVGLHVVRWNRGDNQGHNVASGVYFAKLTAGEDTASRKLVIVR